MGWSVGYDENWKRDIGYGVPAYCDEPGCDKEIDRGLAYVCLDFEPYGGDRGCGLYFCETHQKSVQGEDGERVCCHAGYTAKADHPRWIEHKATDPSWAEWPCCAKERE